MGSMVISDLDNVLYEVSNESNGDSHRWQYHMINYVKSYQATKAKQHPVGMTVAWPGGSNTSLFNSPRAFDARDKWTAYAQQE
jgi:hypothetical protein